MLLFAKLTDELSGQACHALDFGKRRVAVFWFACFTARAKPDPLQWVLARRRRDKAQRAGVRPWMQVEDDYIVDDCTCQRFLFAVTPPGPGRWWGARAH